MSDIYLYAHSLVGLSIMWWNSFRSIIIIFDHVFVFSQDSTSTASTMSFSMTSLFAHKVAQSTKWRFLPENLNQLFIFVIGLAFTWVWGDKNHQNLIIKVNFLYQKSFIILIFVFVKIIWLGEQLIIKPFFDNSFFWSSSFSEIVPYFCWLMIKWMQVQSQK